MPQILPASQPALGRAIAMGYARGAGPLRDEMLFAARYEVDIAGERFAVTLQLTAKFGRCLRHAAHGRLTLPGFADPARARPI